MDVEEGNKKKKQNRDKLKQHIQEANISKEKNPENFKVFMGSLSKLNEYTKDDSKVLSKGQKRRLDVKKKVLRKKVIIEYRIWGRPISLFFIVNK